VGKRKNCQIDAHASEATAFDYPGKLTAPPYSYKPLQLTFRCFIDNTLAIGLREPQEDPSSPVQACELEDEGKVGGLLKYKDRTLSKIEIESFDRQFAVWGYNHGLSFAQLTDPDLPRILGFLNRSYTSRSMLSDFRVRNTYLNDAYRAIRLRVASSIRSAPAICLVTDGWTSVQRSHQLCVTLTTPTPVFFRTIHTGSQSVTAEFQAESLVNSLDDDSIDIDAMCTDYASVMVKTWRLMQAKIPGLICYGCSCHAFESFGKSLSSSPEFTDMLTRANTIIQYFRSHTQHNGLAFLQDAQLCTNGKIKALSGTNVTRWHSTHDSVVSLLACREALTYVVNTEDWPLSGQHSEITSIVQDKASFWSLLKEFKTLTLPIKLAIKHLESDTAYLSDVYAAAIAMDLELQSSSFKVMSRDKLHQRLTKALCDVHVAAYLLDNRYVINSTYPLLEAASVLRQVVGKHRPVGEDIDALTLESEIAMYFAEVAKFTAKRSPIFSTLRVRLSPNLFWQSLQDRFPNLFFFAGKAFSLPASAASAERVWSASSHITSASRSKLQKHRSEKQVAIYFNSRTLTRSPHLTASKQHLQDYATLSSKNSSFQHITAFKLTPLATDEVSTSAAASQEHIVIDCLSENEDDSEFADAPPPTAPTDVTEEDENHDDDDEDVGLTESLAIAIQRNFPLAVVPFASVQLEIGSEVIIYYTGRTPGWYSGLIVGINDNSRYARYDIQYTDGVVEDVSLPKRHYGVSSRWVVRVD
jgi:hypothetical protein